MTEQNVSAPESAESFSSDSAISNLRGAIDSIGRLDLNVDSSMERTPTAPLDKNTTDKEINYVDSGKKDEVKNEDNQKVEQTEKEYQPEDETQSTSESQPQEDKAKIRWKELKQAEVDLKNAQKELSELKKRGDEFEQQAKEVAELKANLEEIQNERDSIDSELYLTRVQATKEWDQYITQPLNGIISDVEYFAKRNQTNAGELINAIQADVNGNPQELESVIADWSERDKTKVWALADNLLQIEKRKADIESNSKLAYEASLENQNKEAKIQQEQYYAQRESAISEVLPKITEKVFNLLPEDKRPNADLLKKELMDYDSWPENLKVYGILGATVLPDLIEQINTLKSQLNETKENNVKIRSSSPSVNSGNSPRTPQESMKSVDYSKIDTDAFVKGLVSRMAT
jgi:hypothetical protein